MKTIKLKKPLEAFTPTECLNAIETVENCRRLVYSTLGKGLCEVLSPPDSTCVDNDPVRSYKAGWKDGIEALLRRFPDGVGAFTISEVLEAVYGGEEA